MSKELEMQLAGFKSSIQGALDKFNSQDALVKTIQEKMTWLEQQFLTNSQQQQELSSALLRGDRIGFSDAKTAKEFVGLVKGVFLKEDDRVKDMVEGRDPDGGYLVRPEYRNTILMILEQFGVARRNCTVIPVTSNELTMPKLTGGVQVYWVGEGSTIPTTQPQFGEFKIIVKKLAALVPMTNELLADSSIAIANLLATLFGQAIAKEEDRVVFRGDVTVSDPFNGVLYDPGVKSYVLGTGKTSFTGVTADDMANAITIQPSAYIDGAKFYMHRTIFNVLRQLKTIDGAYIWAAPTVDGQPGTIWGYPYELVDSMPSIAETAPGKPFAFFGNLKHYYIADRQQMSIARSEHVGFAQDKTFIRVIQREGMAYALPETGVVLRTSLV